MLVPFTKDLAGDDVDEDDVVSDGEEEEEEDDIEEGREEFDGEAVEAAMREVNDTYTISADQAQVARSSLTKVSTPSLLAWPLLTRRRQLKRLAKNLHHSATDAADLEDTCIKASIPPKKMKRSVPTRWNSVAEASGCALDLKKPLGLLWDMPKHKHRTAKLRKYKLSDEEWAILKELYTVLEVCTVLFCIHPSY